METQGTIEAQSETGQIDLSAPPAQVQGASQGTMENRDKPEETELTPKLKEKVTIQALLTLPKSGTPSSHTLQKPSTDVTPLQISVPSPSSSKAKEVITYGDVSLDEEIVLPKYDFDTMRIEQMGILQEALARKKHQELLRREHRHKKTLMDIKYIFLDAFNMPTLDETKPLI